MTEEVCYPRVKNIGLRGITVADTRISMVDGVNGELIYRGYRIQDLAENATYEEVIHLLLYGTLPNPGELAAFDEKLRAARPVPDAVFAAMAHHPNSAHPMDVLQSAVPFLADYDEAGPAADKETLRDRSIRLVAQIPALVAGWKRIREGLAPVAHDPALGHAANFLYMLNGEAPGVQAAKTFDVCLTLHADHTFNASTFAAREVASTRAHLHAAVTAAVGALSGELHGGANAKVMQMLRQIGEPDNVETFVKEELDGGGRIMGMGHAVYKTMDPRAVVLRALAEGLARETGGQKWLDISEKVLEATQREFKARKDAEIWPNVDFFSASVYYQMGIDVDLFTPVFAVGRAAGWCAHVIEESFAEAQEKPALYRPKAQYVGDYCGPTGCTWIPLDEREK